MEFANKQTNTKQEMKVTMGLSSKEPNPNISHFDLNSIRYQNHSFIKGNIRY
jgi:hypothetical protein